MSNSIIISDQTSPLSDSVKEKNIYINCKFYSKIHVMIKSKISHESPCGFSSSGLGSGSIGSAVNGVCPPSSLLARKQMCYTTNL